MLNLLNIKIFDVYVDVPNAKFWLYVAQAAIVLIGLIMFFILLARTRRPRKEQVEIGRAHV